MSGQVARCRIHYRSESMREAVALWCKTPAYCSSLQREIMRVQFEMDSGNAVIASQFSLSNVYSDRVRTQIPIDRRKQ